MKKEQEVIATDKAFLFQYQSLMMVYPNPVFYTLIYAADVQSAFNKLDDLLNKANKVADIRLATQF